MRSARSVALVSCLFSLATLSVSACAASTEEEESGASSDALTQAAGFAYVDALQVKYAADSNPTTNPVIGGVNANTRLILYCKAENSGGTYLGSNVRSTLGMSYVKDFGSNVTRCLDANNRSIGCNDLVARLPACAPVAGSVVPHPGSAAPATPPVLAKLVPPTGAHVLLTTTPPLLRAGYFDEPVSVHSAAKATFDVGAVWNAYDASHRIIGQSTCHESQPFAFNDSSASFVFDCWGSATGASSFEVVYFATGASAGAAHL